MTSDTFQHYFVGLLAVANNFSALPTFLALVTGVTAAQALKVTSVASLSAFIIMIITMAFGTDVLAFFGITISAFQIAGGVLLGAVGMSMLNSKSNTDVMGKNLGPGHNMTPEELSNQTSALVSQAIVPISMPLTAGAGAISTVTLFSETAARTGTQWQLFAAICAMTIFIFLVFHFAIRLIRILGNTGMNVMIKVMGLFILAIGVQFIVSGVSTIYKGLVS